MNTLSAFRIFLVTLSWGLSVTCAGQSVNDKPEKQVVAVLTCNTAFPDAMYETMDWKAFINSELAKRVIDYQFIDYNLLNAAVFYYTNKFRDTRHMPSLLFSHELRDAAVFHCLEMVNRKFYAHVDPHMPTMQNPLKRAQYFKFPSETVGENIAQQFLIDYPDDNGFRAEGEGNHLSYFFTDGKKKDTPIRSYSYGAFAEQIVRQWIQSPQHQKNMLSKDYSFMGCGIYADKHTITKTSIPAAYGTQDFGGLE